LSISRPAASILLLCEVPAPRSSVLTSRTDQYIIGHNSQEGSQ
jgi:hypothetical protein